MLFRCFIYIGHRIFAIIIPHYFSTPDSTSIFYNGKVPVWQCMRTHFNFSVNFISLFRAPLPREEVLSTSSYTHLSDIKMPEGNTSVQ